MCSIATNQGSAVRSAPRADQVKLIYALVHGPDGGGRFKLSLLHQAHLDRVRQKEPVSNFLLFKSLTTHLETSQH